jgi:hypothetical protein
MKEIEKEKSLEISEISGEPEEQGEVRRSRRLRGLSVEDNVEDASESLSFENETNRLRNDEDPESGNESVAEKRKKRKSKSKSRRNRLRKDKSLRNPVAHVAGTLITEGDGIRSVAGEEVASDSSKSVFHEVSSTAPLHGIPRNASPELRGELGTERGPLSSMSETEGGAKNRKVEVSVKVALGKEVNNESDRSFVNLGNMRIDENVQMAMTQDIQNILNSFLGLKHSNMWYDYRNRKFYEISDESGDPEKSEAVMQERIECETFGFKAVTGPRSFEKALKDPKWGEPSRIERETLRDGPIVQVDESVAREAIAKGADLVKLFPGYEEKIKDGKTVYKVRLVGDGRTHYNAGNTYAETPSRDEFKALMHIVAH